MQTNRTIRALSATALGLTLALTTAACGSNDDTSETGARVSTTEHNDTDVAFASDMLRHHAQALAMVDLTQGRTLDLEVQQLADDIKAAQGPEIETLTGWLTDWNETVPTTSPGGSMRDRDTSMRGEGMRGEGMRGEGMRGEGMRGEGMRGEGMRGEGMRGEDMRGEGMRGEGMRGEGMRGEGMRGEDMRGEDMRGEDMRGEMPGMMSGAEMPGMMSAAEMADLAQAPDADFQDLWLEMMIEHHSGAVDMAETETEQGQYEPAVDLATAIAESQTAEVQTMENLLAS